MPEPTVDGAPLPEFSPERFPESLYLVAFPDVREAIATGLLSSGHEHYELCGRTEIEVGLRPNPFVLVPGALDGLHAGLSAGALNGGGPDVGGADGDGAGRAGLDVSGDGTQDAATAATVTPATLGESGGVTASRTGLERRQAPADRRAQAAEGSLSGRRSTRPTMEPPDLAEDALFDPATYLAVNPDVARAVAAGRVPDAQEHWRRLGREEERRGVRPSILADEQFAHAAAEIAPADEEGFDAEGYLFANPDVRAAIGDDPAAAAAHWREHGRVEGRVRRGVAAFASRKADPRAVMARPFGLNVFGPFAAASGLGTAARNLVHALRAAGLPFALFPFDVQTGAPRLPRDWRPFEKRPSEERPGGERTSDEAGRSPHYRINLVLANADQMGPLVALYPPGTFDDAYTIGMWAWELAAFRPDWFECFGAVDEVWTNSDFEVAAIGAVSPVPVTKIRLPVLALAGDREAARVAFGVPPDRVVFLVAFDAGSTSARKNPRLAVEAFREAFGPDDPVFLVIKFHSNNLEPEITREVSRALRGVPNVLVVAERISEAEMALLRACADCYVSAHRAEGYGLNIAEFMALGRPVIATGYSGNLEFLDETTGYLVGYRLAEIESQAGPYRPHYVWAEPDRAGLIAAMRQVVADPAEAARRGAAGAARMSASFGRAAVGQAIAARLAALGLNQPSPAFLGLLGRTRGLRLPALLGEHSEAERAEIALGERRPVFSVLLAASAAADRVAATLAALLVQSYPLWEIVLVEDDSVASGLAPVLASLQGWDPRVRLRRMAGHRGLRDSLVAAAEMTTGEWLVLLPAGAVLAPSALLALTAATQPATGQPPPEALYSDEHRVNAQGAVVGHRYRPDLSPELLEACAYTGGVLALRKTAFLERAAAWSAEAPDGDGNGGGDGGDMDAIAYDLLLHLLRRRAVIRHVAAPLYQLRDDDAADLAAQGRVLRAHAACLPGAPVQVEPGLVPGSARLRRPFAVAPRVSILLAQPFASPPGPDEAGAALGRLVAGLSALLPAALSSYDIVLVGDARLAAGLPAGLRLVSDERAVSEASRINLALRQARSEFVVLLGPGVSAAASGWLEALLEPLQDPDIGIVGGWIATPDGLVREAGMMLGPHGPAPLLAGQPVDDPGYAGLARVIRNVSAVGAGCLASRRSVLSELGGFDETLPPGLAEADLCLRAAASAYRVVCTPFATLTSTKPPPPPPSAMAWARFEARWPGLAGRERFYNPAFVPDGSFGLR